MILSDYKFPFIFVMVYFSFHGFRICIANLISISVFAIHCRSADCAAQYDQLSIWNNLFPLKSTCHELTFNHRGRCSCFFRSGFFGFFFRVSFTSGIFYFGLISVGFIFFLFSSCRVYFFRFFHLSVFFSSVLFLFGFIFFGLLSFLFWFFRVSFLSVLSLFG